jgi:protein-S-isoprenylcysteine O-methyltransferase Ste14
MIAFIYAVLAYSAFLVVSVYAVGFAGGFLVPASLDGPLAFSFAQAVTTDIILLMVFGLQHSVMARPWFKKIWTRFIPVHAERSTYVLISSALMVILFAGWRPVPDIVWDLASPLARWVVWGLFGAGWGILLLSTFMISHVELFGLKQAWANWRRQRVQDQPFRVRWFYKLVRHPIMLGFFIAFWAVPTMTLGHLIFSIGMTVYIFIGLIFEERDLVTQLGDDYVQYQRRVPMLIPFTKRGE